MKELSLAAEGLEGHDALHAMGEAYVQLMQDPELLQVQMHGYAAATGDPDVAAACRKTFEVLFFFVKDQLGLDEQMIQDFFAQGMLMSVMSAINLLSVRETWAESICPGPEKVKAVMSMSKALRDGAAGTSGRDQAHPLRAVPARPVPGGRRRPRVRVQRVRARLSPP